MHSEVSIKTIKTKLKSPLFKGDTYGAKSEKRLFAISSLLSPATGQQATANVRRIRSSFGTIVGVET